MPKVLIRFLYVWLFYWFTFLLIPTSNSSENILSAFLLQMFFVIIVLLTGSITYSVTASKLGKVKYESGEKIISSKALRHIRLGINTSIVGFVMNILGKVYFDGIYLFQSVAKIRYEWVAISGTDTNIFSILSYLFGFTFFSSAIFLVSLRGWLRERKARFYFILCLLLLLLNSILIGGRSGVLLFLAMVGSIYFETHHRPREKVRKRGLSLGVIFMLLCMLLYVVFIFYERSAATSVGITEYVDNFMPYLGFAYDNKLQHGSLNSFASVLHLIGAYLTHSLNSFSYILSVDDRGGLSIFSHFYGILRKTFGVLPEVQERILTGRYLSLPGALYYQLGIFGIVFGAMFLGFVCGFVFKRKSVSLSSFFWRAFVEAQLLLSPLVLAFDFLFLPFIVLGYCVLRVFARRSLVLRWQASD